MRLTQHIKGKIIQLMLEDVKGIRPKQLGEMKIKLALDVYHTIYGKYLSIMESLPATAFAYNDLIDVKFFTRSDTLHLGESKKQFYKLPISDRTFPADHKLTKDWENLQKVKDKLYDDCRMASREVGAILNSVTTDKRLLEVWPEGAHWITKAIPESCTTTLPAVQIENVNKMLCQLIGKNSPTCEDK